MQYKRKKGKMTIQSKKKEIDGIKFDSTLESYMYTLLRDNNIENTYEGEKFTLIDGFKFDVSSFERTANKPMIDRGNNKIRAITYTPDFVSKDFIIEVKGRANESFPMRWKLFKRWISINRPNTVLYKPQSQVDCRLVIEDILKRFY
jgi:hypothetical protein